MSPFSVEILTLLIIVFFLSIINFIEKDKPPLLVRVRFSS
jgi:hypothetical protein